MRRPFGAAAFDPTGRAGADHPKRGFVVIIANQPPDEEDEAPFDLSAIPTLTEDDILHAEETEKRREVEQILAQQAIVLETLGRRKVVTAATVAFGLGVAATLLVRGRMSDEWN